MPNVLVISGHPNLQQSTANSTILAELASGLPTAEIRKLDELYPNFQINVEAEQEALAKADIIVWQFPVNWYHFPAIMQKWLSERGVQAKLLENRSMNTCENTRFSSLLLQKKGGAPTVLLITDRYHMPRTRRLFALNGIETIPVNAPMPTQLTAWQPSKQN